MLDIETIRATLAQYGDKSMTSGFQITKGGHPCYVLIGQRKGRMRFESTEGNLIMSGPCEVKTIETFVEKYWFWEKV